MRTLCSFGLLLALAASLQAQQADTVVKRNPYGTGAGGEIVLTNSGFGLGGYLSRGVGPLTSLTAEASLGIIKDERETKFVGYSGPTIQDKANYLLALPVRMGVFHRLFSNHIEDNFRPYVHLTGGPTLGWVYPYFADCNGDGLFDREADCDGDGVISQGEGERQYDAFTAFPKGRLTYGFAGLIAFGAHFGESKRTTQGIRVGYGFQYFPDGVQLLEPDVKPAQRYFGTPTISLTFGRLF